VTTSHLTCGRITFGSAKSHFSTLFFFCMCDYTSLLIKTDSSRHNAEIVNWNR